MAPGLFMQAQAAGTTQIVQMGQVGFLPFGRSDISCTGTAGLAGCFAVAIVSQLGVILAHIPPDDVLGSTDIYSGENVVRYVMDGVGCLFTEFYNYFRAPRVRTHVVCAIRGGEIVSPHLKEIIDDRLVGLGLDPNASVYYEIDGDYDPESSKGTVFIDGRDELPIVYVEDQVVYPGQFDCDAG